MAKNLYVGNMSFSTTEEQLRQLFSQHGTVTKVQLIMDRETGRPSGLRFRRDERRRRSGHRIHEWHATRWQNPDRE